jgi:hypothetical protein
MKKLTVLPRISITLFAVIVVMFCLSLWNGKTLYAENKGPCADDVAKFCKDVKPGGGGIAKCLKKHANELSAGCKEGITEKKQKAKDFTEACRNDLAKYCKDVKRGGGRMVQCLKKHENELSAECKAQMTSAK